MIRATSPELRANSAWIVACPAVLVLLTVMLSSPVSCRTWITPFQRGPVPPARGPPNHQLNRRPNHQLNRRPNHQPD
jgi:hypothetical protein